MGLRRPHPRSPHCSLHSLPASVSRLSKAGASSAVASTHSPGEDPQAPPPGSRTAWGPGPRRPSLQGGSESPRRGGEDLGPPGVCSPGSRVLEARGEADAQGSGSPSGRVTWKRPLVFHDEHLGACGCPPRIRGSWDPVFPRNQAEGGAQLEARGQPAARSWGLVGKGPSPPRDPLRRGSARRRRPWRGHRREGARPSAGAEMGLGSCASGASLFPRWDARPAEGGAEGAPALVGHPGGDGDHRAGSLCRVCRTLASEPGGWIT